MSKKSITDQKIFLDFLDTKTNYHILIPYFNNIIFAGSCAGYVWRLPHHLHRLYAESSAARCTSDKWYSSGGCGCELSTVLMTGWRQAPLISEMLAARVILPELGVCLWETESEYTYDCLNFCQVEGMSGWTCDTMCWQMGVNGYPTTCTPKQQIHTPLCTKLKQYNERLNIIYKDNYPWECSLHKEEEPPLGCLPLPCTPVIIHVTNQSVW